LLKVGVPGIGKAENSDNSLEKKKKRERARPQKRRTAENRGKKGQAFFFFESEGGESCSQIHFVGTG